MRHTHTRRGAGLIGVLALVALAACNDALNPSGKRAEGLGTTDRAGGPRVLWDALALPLPEIPLPNDAATRLDPTSPTGRRLNISTDAPTEYERRTRRSFNELDGFGTYGAVNVSFDALLDLADMYARHNNNDDFRDDAVYLLNVDPDCSRYGEEVALDVGRGRFPITFYRRSERIAAEGAPGGYISTQTDNVGFQFDLRAEYNQMLFEERNEDANGNGALDEGEDFDRDGILDVANFLDPRACDGLGYATTAHDQCVADNLMTWYDRGSNTLVLRSVWPLEQQCTYAVVLTKRLRGANGQPVESPFPAVNPRDQAQALAPVPGLLARYGLGADDIAFAWSFTTGTMTRDLEALRAGLYGHGPFAQLAAEFPVEEMQLWTRGELDPESAQPDERSIDGACAGIGLTLLWQYGIGEWDPNMCALESDNSAVGGMFGGTFNSPDLLVDREDDFPETARYPGTHDESWQVNYLTGEAIYGEDEVTFWCTVPYASGRDCEPGNPEGRPFCEPFPTILYGHGYGGARGEVTSHMGRTNAMGYAACSLDAYGHGLNVALSGAEEASQISQAAVFFDTYGIGEFVELLARGRDRDLNNDALEDPGADQWTADLFHTRDMVRQSVLDYIQFVRILRAMDGRRGADGTVLGDADGNGVPDIGGPQNTVSMWGISLGGITAGVLAGAEPSLDAVSPNAGGAGLSDVSLRSSQPGVPEAVILPVLGPFVAGCLPTDELQNPLPPGETTSRDCFLERESGTWEGGVMRLAYMLNNNARMNVVEFATVGGVEPGDRVVVENLVNGEVGEAWVTERGWFRAAAASDALNAIDRRPILGMVDGIGDPVRVPDVETLDRLGDRLRVTFYVGDTDAVRGVVDRFGRDVTFQGTTYPRAFPLVALQEGLGQERNTPDYRRFFGFAQFAVTPGDPAVWAERYFLNPADSSYDGLERGSPRVLVVPTAGDNNVPVNTGIANARTAGVLGSWLRDESIPAEYGWRELFVPDERYGVSIDQELIDRYVVEGDPRLERYPDNPVTPRAIYDIDNVSDGTASFSCGNSDWSAISGESGCPEELIGQEVFFPLPRPEPGRELRQNRARGDGSFDAMRIPVLRPAGQHGIYNAQPFRTFDNDGYAVNFTLRFLGTRGRRAEEVPGCDCTGELPSFRFNGFSSYPSFNDPCLADDPAVPDIEEPENTMNVCSPACLEAWGIVTPQGPECVFDP